MIRLRHFGPAMTAPTATEAFRAAIGAGIGLVLCDLILWLTAPGAHGLFLLIAPFGASAFLIFVVPNSPLAQPWSAVMGNTLSAFAAIGTLALTPDLLVAAPLAVALAILCMAVARAFHPPAGAVALATVIAAQSPGFPGWSFALSPVFTGTAALVAAGILWNRATGRVYPFRQPPAPSAHGTTDPAPDRRLGLAPAELAHLLDRLRMAPNIGIEDLARVLTAAETEAAARHLGHLTAADIMSRDVVSATPTDDLSNLARRFRDHRFKTLPVNDGGRYVGLIDQSALLGLTDPTTTAAALAAPVATLPPTATAAELMDLLADGHQQAVPILDGPRLVGLVTRSDLIALLSARLREG